MQEKDGKDFELSEEGIAAAEEMGWEREDLEGAPSESAAGRLAKWSPEEIHGEALEDNELFELGYEKGGTDSLTGFPLRHRYEKDIGIITNSLFREWRNGVITWRHVKEMVNDDSLREALERYHVVNIDIDYLSYWNLGKFRGHDGGNKVITAIADTISGNSGVAHQIKARSESYQPYRVGGDEFGLVVQERQSGAISDDMYLAIQDEVQQIDPKSLDSTFNTDIRIGVSLAKASFYDGLLLTMRYMESTHKEYLSFGDFITVIKTTTHKIVDRQALVNKLERRMLFLSSHICVVEGHLEYDLDPAFISPAKKGLEGFEDADLAGVADIGNDAEARKRVRGMILGRLDEIVGSLKMSEEVEDLREGLVVEYVKERVSSSSS